MISVQPILSFKYFQLRKNSLPKGIRSLFYLSWEDALWDLLYKKNIKKGSYILVPDFYCNDVEKNIKQHGYKIGHYKINKNLSVDKKSFQSKISQLKPGVIVVFHPVGIKSNLFENITWLKNVTKEAILIEDSVHRVIDRKEIKIIKKNHFAIDSLRKVVPLQGARMYGKIEDLNFDEPTIFQSFFYRVKVSIYWFLMIICWTLGFGILAEKLMIKGYEIIGDSKKPSRGSFLSKLLSNHINIRRIQKERVKQFGIYMNKITNRSLGQLKIKEEDKKHLRGFPIILSIKNADMILGYLRCHGLLVCYELDGSFWSTKQKIIYLPFGPQMNKKSNEDICNLVNKAFEI